MKWLLKFIREDLKIIATFLFVILLIVYGFAAFMGFLALGTADFGTPSVSRTKKADLADSDGDNLPDIIEGTAGSPCQEGEDVYLDGKFIGKCTETDPHDIDTDNDGFTDAVEDALGTNPRSFFSPGWVYIMILVYASVFLFFRFYEGDPLKEYREFEMQASESVSSESGKFAYGGSSKFAKRSPEEVSDEEKRKAIESDARFQRMTSEKQEEDEPKMKKKRNYGALIIQIAIATLLGLFIFLIAGQS